MNRGWINIPMAVAFEATVPKTPGIYVIMDVQRLLGLPIGVEPVYVGRSVNLFRRFREHAVRWMESNPLLKARSHKSSLEFWFRRMPRADLDKIERQMIRRLLPGTNRIQYSATNEGGQS